MLIRHAAQHDAIDVRQVRLDCFGRVNAAVKYEAQCGKLLLQSINVMVFQWRYYTVFLWRKSFKHCIAGVNQKCTAAGLRYRGDKVPNEFIILCLINAE